MEDEKQDTPEVQPLVVMEGDQLKIVGNVPMLVAFIGSDGRAARMANVSLVVAKGIVVDLYDQVVRDS